MIIILIMLGDFTLFEILFPYFSAFAYICDFSLA